MDSNLLPWPPNPIALTGDLVRLEPLAPGHAPGIAAAIRDGELDKLWYTIVPSPEGVEAWITAGLAQQAAGRALPFAVRRLRDGLIVGSTRFMNI